MIVCRNILMSGQTGPILGTPATTAFTTPELRCDDADEVVYRITVEGTVGSPTSAFLKAEFQIAQRTTNGEFGGSEAYTDRNPIWQSIDANTHGGMLPDGDWPTRIWRSEDGTTVVVQRRIRGGCSNRLKLTPIISGGTSPGIKITVEAEVRYV